MEPDDDLLTKQEAAAFVGVSLSTIDRHYRPGHPGRFEGRPRGEDTKRPVVRYRRAALEQLKRELGR